MKSENVELRYLVTCLDGRRIPLNAEERAKIPGLYPYWGAGSIVDHVGEYLFDEELVLLGEDGAPFFDPARPVAFRVDGPVWVNNHIHVLRPTARTDARFLTYALNVVDYGAYIDGSTRDKLTQDDMRRIAIPFQNELDQRRIADFLDDQVGRIDNIIAARQAQDLLVEEDSAGQIEEAIENHFDRYGSLPLRRLAGGVEQGWSPLTESRPAEFGEPGVLKLSAVSRGSFHPVENKAMLADSGPDKRFAVHLGDFLISRANTPDLVGDCAVVDRPVKDLYLPDLLYRVQTDDPAPQYLSAVVRSRRVRGLMRTLARGTSQSMVKLRGSDILDLLVPNAPTPLRIQSGIEFVAIKARSRSLSETLKQAIDALIELKMSLITAAVSGEFDVSAADGSGVRV